MVICKCIEHVTGYLKSGCTEWFCVTNDAISIKIICIFVEVDAKENTVEKHTDSKDIKM